MYLLKIKTITLKTSPAFATKNTNDNFKTGRGFSFRQFV